MKKDTYQMNRQVFEITFCGEADPPLFYLLNHLMALHDSCHTHCNDVCQAAGLTVHEKFVTPL